MIGILTTNWNAQQLYIAFTEHRHIKIWHFLEHAIRVHRRQFPFRHNAMPTIKKVTVRQLDRNVAAQWRHQETGELNFGRKSSIPAVTKRNRKANAWATVDSRRTIFETVARIDFVSKTIQRRYVRCLPKTKTRNSHAPDNHHQHKQRSQGEAGAEAFACALRSESAIQRSKKTTMPINKWRLRRRLSRRTSQGGGRRRSSIQGPRELRRPAQRWMQQVF